LIRWPIHCLLWLALLFSSCSLPSLNIPDQPPVPVPLPVVKVDSLWIITVDDALDRVDATGTPKPYARLLGDLDYWQSLGKRGHKWRMEDSDSAFAKKNAAQVAVAGGIPCVILLNAATNKLLAGAKLPTDKAGMEAVIKKFSDK
jgi:hypothetical protein